MNILNEPTQGQKYATYQLNKPLDPTRIFLRRARAVRYAHGFFRPPLFFCKSLVRHCTHPPLLVQVCLALRKGGNE